MYTAIDLANYIVSKCIKDDFPISNLQLQKILYYIQREFLVKRDCPAFSDNIEAWQFGPVVPNVYYHFCGFGAMKISNSYDDYSILPKDAGIINSIVETKRELSPWVMVSETHKADGAWYQIYQNGAGNHKVIPIDLIRKAG